MPAWSVQGQLTLKLCLCEQNKETKAELILGRTMYFDCGIVGCDTAYTHPSLFAGSYFAASQIRGFAPRIKIHHSGNSNESSSHPA